ncbi:MAG: HAD-IA family hydrolase [Xylanivirga thermophila]|jgi:phosphoglycolate phosphatase-like HAD superfamily hydrolase|uniref:HAD-IA family hydrolase n=1 Tax=Xylanivirga thermophila TaxID=2496273 RepID=UPI00101DC235|nr:HAD-IA family hydrolase [Xylanivirga thermophila]
MMFTDIIWDFDGTLFDTYPPMTEAFYKALKEYGIEEDKEEILRKLKISVGNAADFFRDKYELGEELVSRFWFYEKNMDKHSIHLFQDVKEVCSRIKATGRKNYIYTHRGDSTFEYLNINGMDDLFDVIVTKSQGLRGKPHGDGFIYIIEKYDLDRKNVLCIGDRDIDILAAKDAQVSSCFFISNGCEGTVEADFKIYKMEQLLEIL